MIPKRVKKMGPALVDNVHSSEDSRFGGNLALRGKSVPRDAQSRLASRPDIYRNAGAARSIKQSTNFRSASSIPTFNERFNTTSLRKYS